MSFCEVLKELRTVKGVTQKEIAKACELTPTCICQLETGARNPTGSTVAALAVYFGVSADYLLGLEDDFGAKVTAPMSDVEHYSEEEKRLIEDYRALNYSGKKLVKQTAETLRATSAQSEQKKNKIS